MIGKVAERASKIEIDLALGPISTGIMRQAWPVSHPATSCGDRRSVSSGQGPHLRLCDEVDKVGTHHLGHALRDSHAEDLPVISFEGKCSSIDTVALFGMITSLLIACRLWYE